MCIKIINSPVNFCQQVWKEIDPLLIDLIDKMLTKEPSERITLSACLKHDIFKRLHNESVTISARQQILVKFGHYSSCEVIHRFFLNN